MPLHPVEPIVLALVFPCFWFGGAAIMSRMAGWHELSSLYPAPLRLKGDEFRFCTASIGSASFPITYRRCLRVFLTEDGLGMRLMFPFRFYSPPFVAPWASVSSCTEKQAFNTKKVTFTFAGTGRQVTFAGPLGQALKARYQAASASAA